MPDAQLLNDLESSGVVVGNTRFLLHQGLDSRTWAWRVGSNGPSHRQHHDGHPGEILSVDNLRAVMETNGGQEGSHGEELRILVSSDLMRRLARILEDMQPKEDDGETFRTRLWTEAESKVAQRAVEGFRQGRLIVLGKREAVERVEDRALIKACNEAIDFDESLKGVPGSRVFAIGKEIKAIGEAVTFSADEQHFISGLTSEQSNVLVRVLNGMREHPDSAVVVIEPEHKDSYQRFVEALNSGLLPVYLDPEIASYCIRPDDEGDAELVFGKSPDPLAARHLVSAIDQALRAAVPLVHSVVFDGVVHFDGGDLCIGDKEVIEALALLDESLVGFDLTGQDTHIELAGTLDVLEAADADVLKVSGVDLLPILNEHLGQKVTMSVVESVQPTAQPATEESPKTPEEDVVGKTRAALAAAKLIQANREYMETPAGEPDNPGTPSRLNDTAVDRLAEALAWAEQDADEKARPAKG